MKPELWLDEEEEEEEEEEPAVGERKTVEEEGKAEGREGWREDGFVDICISSTDTPHSPTATWGEGGKEGDMRREAVGGKPVEGDGNRDKRGKRYERNCRREGGREGGREGIKISFCCLLMHVHRVSLSSSPLPFSPPSGGPPPPPQPSISNSPTSSLPPVPPLPRLRPSASSPFSRALSLPCSSAAPRPPPSPPPPSPPSPLGRGTTAGTRQWPGN